MATSIIHNLKNLLSNGKELLANEETTEQSEIAAFLKKFGKDIRNIRNIRQEYRRILTDIIITVSPFVHMLSANNESQDATEPGESSSTNQTSNQATNQFQAMLPSLVQTLGTMDLSGIMQNLSTQLPPAE
jgi:hypothetical protein